MLLYYKYTCNRHLSVENRKKINKFKTVLERQMIASLTRERVWFSRKTSIVSRVCLKHNIIFPEQLVGGVINRVGLQYHSWYVHGMCMVLYVVGSIVTEGEGGSQLWFFFFWEGGVVKGRKISLVGFYDHLLWILLQKDTFEECEHVSYIIYIYTYA